MQVVIHAGAHATDDDRLVNCLLENRDALAGIGTAVPQPASYRRLIRDLMHQTLASGLEPGARDQLISAVNGDSAMDRIILSNAGFFGTPKMSLGGGILYGAAEHQLDLFRQLFPDAQIELFMAIRNPASFLPALLSKSPTSQVEELLRNSNPYHIRWSELIERIRRNHPDIPITIWCNEDTPLIWAQVIREMSGLDPTAKIAGEFRLLQEIMSASGYERFTAYVDSHPEMTEIQKRRVIVAFLDKFADEDAIEEELDLPGWTDQLVAELTEIYDADSYEIERLDGVQVITT